MLLTGASGTVSFEVLKQLVEKNLYDVVVFDVKTKKSVKKLSPIKYYMLKQSELLIAYHTENFSDISHYFITIDKEKN